MPYKGGLTMLDEMSHPYMKSSVFKVDLTLERNKRALNKGAGLPKFGKKKDQLASARQYVESIVKPAADWNKLPSIFPGYRTQQSSIDQPKVRLVWQVPIAEWLIECEMYDSAITLTIKENGGNKHELKLFYCEPSEIHSWVKEWEAVVNHWVSLDATSYDSSVRKSELETGIHYFGHDYQFVDVVVGYTVGAQLVLPEGDLTREGGMPSGSKGTNLLDGFTNIVDILECLERLGIRKYLKCCLINGDDITLGFATRITNSNLDKLNRYSRREINSDKSVIGEYVWNSKWYMDEQIMTRPIFRVINSAMFKEHQTNPITGSKEYVAIALAQQLLDIEMHPESEVVLGAFAKADKYPISKFNDAELIPYAQAWLDDHNWAAEWIGTPSEIVKRLKSTRYAKIAG